MSSWDSSAPTAPGIQSFIKDESQILEPQKSAEATEEEKRTESESIPEDLYAVPRRDKKRKESGGSGVSKFSVECLSQMFEEIASSPVHAQPDDRAPRAKSPPTKWPTKSPPTKSPTKSPPTKSPAKSPPTSPTKKSPEPKPLPPLPTKPATSGDADYDLPPDEQEYLYQVLYDYSAADSSELTIKEGESVISVAGFTPDMSPGWLMVRHEGELEEGWVPESYLKNLGPVYDEAEPTGASGSGQAAQQVPSFGNGNPICKLMT